MLPKTNRFREHFIIMPEIIGAYVVYDVNIFRRAVNRENNPQGRQTL